MSLLNYELVRDVEPGTYTTRITSYREVANEGKQPYIELEMYVDNMFVTDRLYASRIPYFMNCVRKQFHLDYYTTTLSMLLNKAKSDAITVTISYDAKYGRQIDYRKEVL